MKIVAVDPGVSTGVAIKLDDSYITVTLSLEDISGNQLLDYIKGADQVVIEQFVGYASHGMRVDKNGFRTTEVVGKVTAYCEILGIPIERQPAQSRHAFQKKANGMTLKGSTVHEKDALAHLLLYEYKLDKGLVKHGR